MFGSYVRNVARVGASAARRPWRVVVGLVVLLMLLGGVAAGGSAGYSDEVRLGNTDSQSASDLLTERFPRHPVTPPRWCSTRRGRGAGSVGRGRDRGGGATTGRRFGDAAAGVAGRDHRVTSQSLHREGGGPVRGAPEPSPSRRSNRWTQRGRGQYARAGGRSVARTPHARR